MSPSSRPATARNSRLRHPAELPFFIFMVVLNFIIIGLIIQAAVTLPLLPERLQESGWAVAVRSALIGLLLLIPALVVIRETQRAAVRGTAVELSPRQYSSLYQVADEFAHRLGLRRRPQIYLSNGNGALNAFAAQHPEGISNIHIIAAGLPLANTDAREALAALMKTHDGRLACAGTVLDGTGFWASATRGVIMSLQLLAPSSFAMRTCASDAELVSWIVKPHAQRTGVTLDPQALEHAMARARALST